MMTLGVYSGDGEHAAVVVNAGAVVSAVHAAGPVERTAVPYGVQEALDLAGVRLGDLDEILTTDGPAVPFAQRVVSSPAAQAAQLRAVASETRLAIVVDDTAAGAASIVDLDMLSAPREIAGSGPLLRAAHSVAQALGLPGRRPIAALESIAAPDACTSAAASVERTGDGFSVAMNLSVVDALLNGLAARCASPADVAASPHVEIQRIRAQAAVAVLEGLATAFADVAQRAANDSTGAPVGFAGTSCASPEFVARLRRRVEAAVVSPVPEPFGEALGAALIPHREVQPLASLALGCSFGENEIKAVLENCRLDYVYEPDWSRLCLRVSDLLATGALIGWYQGRADFSRESFGTRSILCDPSRRYSRENVNVFLLNRSVHAPLRVSLEAAVDARSSRGQPLRFAYELTTASGDDGQRLLSAINRHGTLRCHVADPVAVPEFHALLRTHRDRTQVPGLLNVPMLTGDVLAPTPRDAVRATFASAADALVIGRFLVAKDYWLLRGRGAAPGASAGRTVDLR